LVVCEVVVMRVHQNIVLDGQDIGERSSLRYSKFCNEGKWDNFIAPLLPEDCSEMTFVEIGCNAGLFLRMATEWGFQRVVGVEADKNAYQMGIKYRDSLGLNYRIHHAEVGEQFDFTLLPAADVVLMANVHYYMHIRQLVYVLDHLLHKARRCVIVSIQKPRGLLWKGRRDLAAVRGYFADWQEIGSVPTISPDGDPHPRSMYSIAFASKIERVDIAGIRARQEYHPADAKASKDFINKCLHRIFDVRSTRYYHRELRTDLRRSPHPGQPDAFERVQDKKDLIRDIRDNGIKNPILIDSDGKLLDGVHRLLTMEVMGYKTILARRVNVKREGQDA
jgi:SAM-dependent methyltransferase